MKALCSVLIFLFLSISGFTQVTEMNCGDTATGNFGQSGNEYLFGFENHYQSQLNIILICEQSHLDLFSRLPELPWPSDTCWLAEGYGQIDIASLPKGTYYIRATGIGPFQMRLYCEEYQLPVELTVFEATAGNGQVTLHWQTASEKDNDCFELQRQTENSQWITIAEIPGSGNSQTTINYEYIDQAVVNGVTYVYCLLSRDLNGTIHDYGQTAEATPLTPIPTEYALHQNFPNPFNPQTSISYALTETGFVTLKVYNVMGQEVANLVDGQMESGHHTTTFDGKNLPAGIYFYTLKVANFTSTKKMLLVK
ncbi:T9SS type A sorting domain-containing protein [Patescibacteria group bacterium]|nr:T9SS type A sorting domain-containing protein [Patescibacteria group bacterium]